MIGSGEKYDTVGNAKPKSSQGAAAFSIHARGSPVLAEGYQLACPPRVLLGAQED
jgi:hypothetical protein